MRLAFGRFTFDSETRELLVGGRSVHISPKAFDLLLLLLERRPNVVSKADIHDRIWAGAFVGDANLSVVVAEIRHVLGDDSKQAQFVRTVHRVGYAFCGPAAPVRASAAQAEAPPATRCWLAWNGQTFPLADGENVIGRDPRCEVWVDATGISRRHARVQVTAEQVTLEDLASRNGTFVAGRRLTASHSLRSGEEVEVGSATMVFRVWSEDRPTKTERIGRRR